MKTGRITTVLASLAFSALVLTGCSTDSSALNGSVEVELDCAVAVENGGGVEVQQSDNCVVMNKGEFALLFSLARDDLEDSRIEVTSGDPLAVVPLESPEADGGFLMGFVGENTGSAEVAVFAKTQGGEEELIQSLSVTVGVLGESVGNAGEWSGLEPEPIATD